MIALDTHILVRVVTQADAAQAARAQDLFAKPQFEFEDRGAVHWAMTAYEAGKGELSDYLIGAKAQVRGARSTYTFDRGLRNQEGFTVLS
jgi:predicted nucleic-acid-binding protein